MPVGRIWRSNGQCRQAKGNVGKQRAASYLGLGVCLPLALIPPDPDDWDAMDLVELVYELLAKSNGEEALTIVFLFMVLRHAHIAYPGAYSTAQHSTAQHSTAQHSTAQHSTAQHSTAQHSTAQRSMGRAGQGRAGQGRAGQGRAGRAGQGRGMGMRVNNRGRGGWEGGDSSRQNLKNGYSGNTNLPTAVCAFLDLPCAPFTVCQPSIWRVLTVGDVVLSTDVLRGEATSVHFVPFKVVLLFWRYGDRDVRSIAAAIAVSRVTVVHGTRASTLVKLRKPTGAGGGWTGGLTVD
ncbi:MAG: type I restriction endonuclease subunit M [Trebouxia sp. A1-2]|nr:MAG: type I restriction endonuclease subunit M [Trebouxia sp. A1-2]